MVTVTVTTTENIFVTFTVDPSTSTASSDDDSSASDDSGTTDTDSPSSADSTDASPPGSTASGPFVIPLPTSDLTFLSAVPLDCTLDANSNIDCATTYTASLDPQPTGPDRPNTPGIANGNATADTNARRAPVDSSDLNTSDLDEADWKMPQTNGTHGPSVMNTINAYRHGYGLRALFWNKQLRHNALLTANANRGRDMSLDLRRGTRAQILGLGMYTPVDGVNMRGWSAFELVLVGFWLCQVPEDKFLKGSCPTAESVMKYLIQKGARNWHDVLLEPEFSAVGCGWAPNDRAGKLDPFQGQWVCDFS